MAGIRGLVKDTAIYGLSSIVGRFLNWCLVPLYTVLFTTSEYGVVTLVYSVVALALIILTYGMETGFFRFANHERWGDPMEVYSTGLVSLAVTSSVFLAVCLVFAGPISGLLHCSAHPSFTVMMVVAVAVDAFTALPFSYLRYRSRPVRFASLKLVNIGLNIGLNLFFLLLCPFLMDSVPGTVDWFYDPEFSIGYIFLSNMIASVVTLFMLVPELTGFRYRFNARLWREMLAYSAPLLVLGVAGIMNQTIDKIIFPSLVSDPAEAMSQLGIYGANYKIAIVMVMFTQAFRFAYEPFIFAKNKESGGRGVRAYSDAMKYFVVFSMVIFLVVMFYLDIVKHLISERYYSGLDVVPVIMMAEVFFGVFFNLSLWYKLTDRTIWGVWFSLLGLAVTLGLNALLVPVMGYMGCAWAAFCCYGVMMVSSYLIGRVKHPIPYELGRIGGYVVLALALYAVGCYLIDTQNQWLDMALRTPLLIIYIAVAVRMEGIPVPYLCRSGKKSNGMV